MAFEERWNKWYTDNQTSKPVYDIWLDKYADVIKDVKTKILDLGCGLGNDTLYLIEKGHTVLACDYSEIALKQINNNMPQVETHLVDISNKLPFADKSFDLIIADLSLHYFDDTTTKQIMTEIKRVLSSHGVLLARVNSTTDLIMGLEKVKKLKTIIILLKDTIKDFSRLKMLKNTFQ